MAKPLVSALKTRAKSLGFDAVGITPARLASEVGEHLYSFVSQSWHGQMGWLKETFERRKTPTGMWPEAKTAIVLAANYNPGPAIDPLARLEKTSTGVISVYALNRDYHDVIKGRLKQLAGWFASQTGEQVKVFVDTAPLMEKPLAAQSGLGWQGKHTNLVSRDFGSWLFLGVILTTAELPETSAENAGCGTCRACIDICPTNAIREPYKIDARACISYLTIELSGPIPLRFRKAIGNRIYGCDDCLAICPWNKFAKPLREEKFIARPDLIAPRLEQLVRLDDQAFRQMFSGSPVKRIGRDRFIRNVLIAIGNSRDKTLEAAVRERLCDDAAIVRAMAVWALCELVDGEEFALARKSFEAKETVDFVLAEWQAGADEMCR